MGPHRNSKKTFFTNQYWQEIRKEKANREGGVKPQKVVSQSDMMIRKRGGGLWGGGGGLLVWWAREGFNNESLRRRRAGFTEDQIPLNVTQKNTK